VLWLFYVCALDQWHCCSFEKLVTLLSCIKRSQIRLMVAAGILSARGLVPPETITAALQLPFKISFPMVPAEGLYLKYAGFGRNADKVRTCFGPCFSSFVEE
jgi:tRNA U38,U39,U40 pseudouridine synthase TruA